MFVISAPSGTGKTTLLSRIMEELPDLRFSVSFTTRPPRSGERDGEDYHFVSHAVFQQMIERGDFLEWAEVLGNRYGTARIDLRSLASEKVDLVLDIDTQGAKRVNEQVDHAVLIFLLPPSPQVLRDRLVNRGLDSPEVIDFRLANAIREISEAHWYHYLIVNDRIEEAVERLKSVIIAERCRVLKNSILNEKWKLWEEHHGTNHR